MLMQKTIQPFDTVRPVLYPSLKERQIWETLPSAERWRSAGQAALQDVKKLPRLPLSLWLQFTQTGDRSNWEHSYFSRRRTLCALVMAEAVTGDGTYLPMIADVSWEICEESAWQLPAHNSYIRDTPQLPLPDVTRPIIDLFAAETGALIATVYGLLKDALDNYAPGFSDRLKAEVERRVLTPYRTEHFWWMGNGDEPMCNWTPWCTQNVLLAAAQCAPADTLSLYVKKAAYSLDCFLKDYGNDGCCSEGAQYYRHAALTMFNALDLMCKIAPGIFDSVWESPKIKNMAEYIVNMHISGPYYLNFADCSPMAGTRGIREYLFGKKVHSVPLMALAARDWSDVLTKPDPDKLHFPDDSEGINLFYHLQTALAEPAVLDYARSALDAVPQDVWYPSVGILVCRRGSYVLGAKAGCNADSHNHNDVGSFTLYKDGSPLLIDIGVETYSKKTFSPQRYEIWTMQSSWHNLPEFDPDGAAYQQQPGAAFAAADVSVAEKLDCISMDIAPAYGSISGMSHYLRRLQLDGNGLILQDTTDYLGVTALTLMSVSQPCVNKSTIHFGTLANAAVSNADRITVEDISITDPRLRQAWPATLYRTRIYFRKQLNLTLI